MILCKYRLLKLSLLTSLFIFSLLNATTIKAGTTTKTLSVSADTYISSVVAERNNNYGASNPLLTDFIMGGGGGKQIFIKFDLSPIHSGATVHTTSLNLYLTECTGTATNIMVYRLTRPFNESTFTWSTGTGMAQGDQSTLANVPCSTGRWYNFYIDDIVKNWVAGQENDGVALFLTAPAVTARRSFASKEATETWSRPQLVVSYDYPDAPASVPPSAPASAPSAPAGQSTSQSTPSTSTGSSAPSSSSSAAGTTGSTAVSTKPADTGTTEISDTTSVNGSTKEGLVDFVSQVSKNDPEKWPYSLNMLQRRLLVGGILIFLIGLIWGIKILVRKLKNGRGKKQEKNTVSQNAVSQTQEAIPEPQSQEQPSKAQAETQLPPIEKKASSQGNGNNRLIIVILVILVVLGAGGYLFRQFAARKTGEKIAEKFFKRSMGSNIDIDTKNGGAKVSDGDTTYLSGSSAEWPSNLPIGTPKYSGGKIASVTDNNAESWSILLGETNRDQFNAYNSSLVSNGWVSTGNAQVMIDTAQYQKNGWDLTISFDESSGGVIITVLKSL